MDKRVCVIQALNMLRDSCSECSSLFKSLPKHSPISWESLGMNGENLIRYCTIMKQNNIISLLRWLYDFAGNEPDIKTYQSWDIVNEAEDLLKQMYGKI